MGKVMVNESSLQDIASAIREKTEGTETYKPSEMGAAIRALKNGVDPADAPKIEYDGKWSGWTLELYDGVLYWEALFSTSGALMNYGVEYTCDAWGIGGGGASGRYSMSSITYNGGGSGYTNMVESVTIPIGTTAVTIGAGATTSGASGGATTFLTLTCSGGGGGSTTAKGGGAGGSNGGSVVTSSSANAGGANGTPGNGKIMSKFWSAEHNTEYGAGGQYATSGYAYGGGGGGFMDFSFAAGLSAQGHGYGGGGGGSSMVGCSGCLIIRIPVE